MNTRCMYDDTRSQANFAGSKKQGHYHVSVPGPGVDLPFYEDPSIRLQKWGANMTTHTMDVDSDLRGLTKSINYGRTDTQNYKRAAARVNAEHLDFSSESPFVIESRFSAPAWTYRSAEQNRWDFPIFNPQERPGQFSQGDFGLACPFQKNLHTRIINKDSMPQPRPDSIHPNLLLPIENL